MRHSLRIQLGATSLNKIVDETHIRLAGCDRALVAKIADIVVLEVGSSSCT